MMTTLGSCLCGKVRYQVDAPLRDVVACHCTQCRKTSGHYVAATQCEVKDLSITSDTLEWYQSSMDIKRGFCRVCGSNLFWQREGSAYISIWAGSIDGPKSIP